MNGAGGGVLDGLVLQHEPSDDRHEVLENTKLDEQFLQALSDILQLPERCSRLSRRSDIL